jgi:geranylgeranyl diphosphate synthase type II
MLEIFLFTLCLSFFFWLSNNSQRSATNQLNQPLQQEVILISNLLSQEHYDSYLRLTQEAIVSKKNPIELHSNTIAHKLIQTKKILNEVVRESRLAVIQKSQEFIETKSQMVGAYQPLYDLLIDYPFQYSKMLRPTVCISVARAVGGMGNEALTSASALELYHNALLTHNDIGYASNMQQAQRTVEQRIEILRNINGGEAIDVLALGLMLENLSVLGVGKALSILHEIEFMGRQSVEGQAMELDWVTNNPAHLTDQDYFHMCIKKNCWSSFITPARIGLIVGYPSVSTRVLVEPLAAITRFCMLLGIAFQIQDDLLNLQGELEAYGKDIGGDIYEGKRTLMLNHVLAHSEKYSDKILEILALPREEKTPEHVNFIVEQMLSCGSIEHGWDVTRSLATKATKILDSLNFLQPETPLSSKEKWQCPLHDRRFLKELTNYIIYRTQLKL